MTISKTAGVHIERSHFNTTAISVFFHRNSLDSSMHTRITMINDDSCFFAHSHLKFR